MPLANPFLRSPQADANTALQAVGVALEQEVARARRQQPVREDVQLARIIDLESGHHPEERLTGGLVGAVVGLGKLTQVASRAVDHRVQDLHDREAETAERINHLLSL